MLPCPLARAVEFVKLSRHGGLVDPSSGQLCPCSTAGAMAPYAFSQLGPAAGEGGFAFVGTSVA